MDTSIYKSSDSSRHVMGEWRKEGCMYAQFVFMDVSHKMYHYLATPNDTLWFGPPNVLVPPFVTIVQWVILAVCLGGFTYMEYTASRLPISRNYSKNPSNREQGSDAREPHAHCLEG